MNTFVYLGFQFRFVVPENSTPGACQWIYPLAFGGGLVGGDAVASTIKLGAGCAAVLSSQDSTKVQPAKIIRLTAM